jgi:hypothetical protein
LLRLLYHHCWHLLVFIARTDSFSSADSLSSVLLPILFLPLPLMLHHCDFE